MTEHRPTEPSDPATIARLVDQLSNADIRWDGTYAGLVPTILSDAGRQLLEIGDDAIPQLLSALEDENKFVAAHVLLTLLSGIEYHTQPWNGLAIELAADGNAHVDARQRFDLARRWRAWQQTTPRPRSLPSE
jgi:hypothetical protein